MNGITQAVGSRETMAEDIHTIARKWFNNPQILIVTGKDIEAAVIEKSSTLFLEGNLVLVLVDPGNKVLTALEKQLETLKERIHIIVYSTARPSPGEKAFEGDTLVMEKNKDKRIRDGVLEFTKRYDKKMTDKGFRLFVERIRDESIMETELMKLVNYVGERKEIKSKDVLAVVTETHEESLLTFFNALARMDKKETLAIFENLLLNGLHILAIHSFLVRQIRLLLQAKDMEEVFRRTSDYAAFGKTFQKWRDSLEFKPMEKKQYLPFQNPYHAFNLSKTSRRIPRKQLISLFNMLAAFDLDVKRGTKYERARLEHWFVEA
jgi:DNA polymerase III delta subunit